MGLGGLSINTLGTNEGVRNSIVMWQWQNCIKKYKKRRMLRPAPKIQYLGRLNWPAQACLHVSRQIALLVCKRSYSGGNVSMWFTESIMFLVIKRQVRKIQEIQCILCLNQVFRRCIGKSIVNELQFFT